jgi:Holliday junction resolvase
MDGMKMSSKGKRKGSGFERELVHQFKDAGHEAKRAYASNGLSLGLTEDVDLLVTTYRTLNNKVNNTPLDSIKIQAKRKKALPKYLGFSDNVDAVVVREDRGNSYIILRLEEFIKRYMK